MARGRFARIKIIVEPNEIGKEFEFKSKVVGGSESRRNISEEFKKGLDPVLGAGGCSCRCSVVDAAKVKLVDGAYHEVDSSALALEVAARARPCARRCGKVIPVLLKPIQHEGGSGDTPKLHRSGDRRSEFAARLSRPGHARQRQCRHRNGAARQYVRLCQQSAFVESGARESYTMH